MIVSITHTHNIIMFNVIVFLILYWIFATGKLYDNVFEYNLLRKNLYVILCLWFECIVFLIHLLLAWCICSLYSVWVFLGGAACTKSVSVYVDPHTIQLQQGKTVLVDGVLVKLPHTITSIGASIVHASSLFIQVLCHFTDRCCPHRINII